MAQQITRLGDGTLFITDAQYVGIGTNDPNEILTVVGNVSASNIFVTSTISASSFSLGAGAGSSSNWDSVYTSVNSNSANWNTAYGWGNHATAGYLTSETSHADVLVDGDFSSQGIMLRGSSAGSYSILANNSSNWNTAYGWGNHASAGYQSALTFGIGNNNTLKVDDTDAADNDYAKFTANGLEGRSAAEVRTDLNIACLGRTTHSLTNLNTEALWSQPAGYQTMVRAVSSEGLPTDHGQSYFGYTITSRRDTGGGYSALLTAYDNSELWFTYQNNNTSYPTWRRIWHDNNHGSGSGLNADLLDGQEGTYYLNYNNFNNTPTIPTDNSQLANSCNYCTTDTTYTVTTVAVDTSNAKIRLTDSSNTTDDITITVAQNLTIGATPASDKITITGPDLSSYATETYVDTSISNLVDSAPTALDTLNELAAALGDDANFSTTITTCLGELSSAIDTKQATLTFGIANTNALKVDDADAADNDYAKFTANGLEGRSSEEVRTDLGLGTIYNCAATDFLAAAGKAADADKLDGQDSTYYGIRNHFQSVGVFNIDCGITGSKTTTSCVMSFLDSCNIFDSYVGALKTGWNYAGNCDLCDAGRLTELAGTSWLTWTDSSSDSTRGNITALVIAPNTGGSANKAFIYNDQGSGYAPGWREIWTKASDGSGSGLDADCLDGQEGTHYLDYNNFTNTPTIPTNYITNDADDTMSGTLTVTGNVSAAGLWDNGKRVCTAAYPTVGSGCITITAGTDLSTGGDFNVNQTGATTITIDHSDITRTDTTSTASPANGGTIDVIDSITSNDRGHITAANVKTITLPSNAANADTVDNLHGTQFLRQDVSTTKVGNLDFTSNNACLSLSNYGRVGIGMTDPQHPLEICLGDNSTFTSGLVFVKNPGNRGSRGHSNGSALFQYCFSDHPGMILNKDGNVGIGTDAPNTRLTVSGSISADTEIYEAGKRVCTAAYPTVTNPNNATITLSAGNGLTTGGDFTTNQNTDETIVFHVGVGTGIVATEDGIAIDDNCNTAWSQNTTYNTATSSTLGLVKIGYTENGKNYPVELSNGQMFVNVPWSNTNTNTTYSVTTVDVAGSAAAKLRLSGSDSTTDDITFAVSQNLTIEATPASDLITITGPDLSSYAQTANLGTAAFENCGTFALAGHNHSGVYDNYGDWDLYTDGDHRANITSGKNVNFIGGTNVSVTYGTGSGNCDVTISATDNNTTYSASTGLTLTGTAFSINSTCRTAIANGATAHGWGNHALAGYCTTDTNTTYSAGNGLTLTSTTFAMDFTNATTTDAFLFYDGTKLKSTNCHITRSNDDVLIGRNATTTGGLGVWGFINVVGKKKIVVNNCDYVINAEGCVRAQVFDAYSDGKYKTDVNNITNAVSTVKNLRGVCFKWNDCFYTRDGGMLPETRNCNYGLIAQEVEEYLPDIVSSGPHVDLNRDVNDPDPNAETFKSMSYDSLIPFLIEAIKEQQTKIEELETRLATLELQSNT